MKAVAVIHDDIWEIINTPDEETGLKMYEFLYPGTVTVKRRDPVWETGIDEDGDPYRRFSYNDTPYDVDVQRKGGGFAEVGQIGQWHVVMVASKASKLQAINQLSESKILGLATIQTDEAGNVTGWDAILNEADRAKINQLLAAIDEDPIPEGANSRQAVRRIWRLINDILDERSFDVGE